MQSDYTQITKHNEHQLGQDTASRKTQISMYSDPTHFVYEILQNADDYGATEVVFKLSKKELQIEHDGKPFTEENVKAITYFGKSTSRDDLVKTGRFGVGFKSVFAFTATPIIISGDEHFQIYGLYRVKEHSYPDGFLRSRTRIVLPFNHESEQPDYVEDLMAQEEAYSKISTRLTTLNMNTLLFTRNIREIRWEIGGRSGHYLREDDINDNAQRTTITDGEHLRKYLVFSRIPRWNNQEYKAVEIVFGIDGKEQITSVDDYLYVLFATKQETHLQFILNGPYRTNPSRETISEDDPFNLHLIKETCELMRDVLPQLRERKLLTTQFLSVLPNGDDKLGDFYAPLFETIVETFHDQELVPTDDNQYASAASVRQGPAPIREVITKEELPFFIDRSEVCWAKGVRENSRAANFLSCLGIEQWEWKQLQEVLADKYADNNALGLSWIDEDDDTWLAGRSDVWLQKLYLLLADAIQKHECSRLTLQRCRIIRVLEDRRQNHVKGSEAYFPKRGYGNLSRIKTAILQGKNQQAEQKIYESLVALGVSEIGEEERIDSLLETSYDDEAQAVSTQQHLQHIKAFIKWWKKEQNASKFESYAIFYTAGKKEMRKPSECFLDSPLRKSGLSAIYSQNASNIPRKFKLWNGYRKLIGEGFCDFASACGIVDRLPIKRQSCWGHTLWPEMREGLWRARETDTGIDEDYHIPDLNKLLKLRKCPINLLVWNAVREADPKVLEAQYRPNQQYGMRVRKSSLVLELTDVEWIPDKKGRLRKPCDLTKEHLYRDFKYDNRNGWLDSIEFGKAKREREEEERQKKEQATQEYQWKSKAAGTLGFSSVEEAQDVARILQEDPGFISRWKAEKQKPTFPERSSQNPERRRKKVSQQYADSSEKKYEQRKRSVRVTEATAYTRTWLKNQYTNESDQMICQICKEEMPFKKRNTDEYYFEAVEALSKKYFNKEHEAQFLALCPECAARYKEFVKNDENVMQEVKNKLANSEDLEIPLQLGNLETNIRFVETHRQDMKTILQN